MSPNRSQSGALGDDKGLGASFVGLRSILTADQVGGRPEGVRPGVARLESNERAPVCIHERLGQVGRGLSDETGAQSPIAQPRWQP